ncbi:site-specific integrase [Corynebacterium guaraldiae]|uniref:site-specific integrase n=1 Tax=Corynebacterium guaraldiae TaxID=3051103 RepID=UPI0012B77A69|nr:site-specific integrase [Corynebacterium guaraldiae]MTD96620.1 hypothetical protein [Corynebacterium guaraldiae]
MARNSWGATRELPSGRWQATYLGPDKQRYKAPDTFRDRLDALAWLAAVRKEIDLGAWQPPVVKKAQTKIPTVGEMVRHWLALAKPQVRDSTYKAYEEIVTARVLGNETLCAIPVDKLTPVAVAAWWQETVQAFPASNHRNARAYHKLRAAIALAVEYGYLPTNPVAINAARTRAKSKAKELPTTAELRAILDNVPERYRLITVLCLFHGLRIGEALAVKNKNFEFDTNGASLAVQRHAIAVAVLPRCSRLPRTGHSARPTSSLYPLQALLILLIARLLHVHGLVEFLPSAGALKSLLNSAFTNRDKPRVRIPPGAPPKPPG